MKKYLYAGISIAILGIATYLVAEILRPEIIFSVRFQTSYSPSDLDIINPERGLYAQYTYDPNNIEGSTDPLAENDLVADRSNNISLVFRLYYLSQFLPPDIDNDPPTHISQAFLDFIEDDLETIRRVGQKAIIRFAYQYSASTYPCDIVHSKDPGLNQVLMHIDDVGQILSDNSDVIAVVQAGFIGTWGEWFYTNGDFSSISFSNSPSRCRVSPCPCDLDSESDTYCTYETGELDQNGDPILDENGNPIRATCEIQSYSANWSNRKLVTDRLLNYLPDSRSIQVRTPQYKNEMYGSGGRPVLTDALDNYFAFDGSELARIGHHNDCFLAAFQEGGTYSSDPVESTNEKAYLEMETRFLPMGGETCAHNSPTSCCDQAEQDLARFHWSYLKKDYNDCVLATWGKTWADPSERVSALQNDGCDPNNWPPSDCAGNCFDDIKKQLGYRFVLLSGSYPSSAPVGSDISFRITLRNEGYAAPFNPRDVELVLRNKRDPSIRYFIPLDEEPRTWTPGREIEISHTVCLPEDMIQDEYDLLLNLPDPEPSLKNDPRYSIRFANRGNSLSPPRDLIWEELTGYNDLLKTLRVEGGEPEEICSSCSDILMPIQCSPNLSANGNRPIASRPEVIDGIEESGFSSTFQNWQYIQIDIGCVIRLSQISRNMTPGDPESPSPYVNHPVGNRGRQGELFSYSIDGANWTRASTQTTSGWENYTYYTNIGSAWHSVDYGWSEPLVFNANPLARYIRFEWDSNFDKLNEIKIDYNDL